MAIRKKQEEPGQGRKVLIGLGLIVAVLLLLGLFFAPGRGLYHYLKLQREIASLTEENRQLESKNIELSEDIKRLRSDEAYIEEVARKKHGFLKKNETVFEFPPPKKKQ